MFSSKKTKEELKDIVAEAKDYFNLQKRYIGVELIAKLTILLSTFIVTVLLSLLGLIVMLCFTFTLGMWLSSLVGFTIAGAIITLCYLIVAWVIYVMRNKWIVQPIAAFLSSLLNK